MPTVELDGVTTSYTEVGDGPPLMLLHGGMSDGTSWGPHPQLLAEHFRVFVPDRRGHGRTPDTEDPFSYDAMARETLAFCAAVIGEPAHLAGWSDGGIAALLAGLAAPEAVNRQVLMGTNFHHDGLLETGLGAGPDAAEVEFMRELYEANAVEGPGHWPTFWAKTESLWRNEPTLTVDDLAQVSVPTLVLVGDDEPIPLAHTVAMYEAIPDAQLGVIPGASHLVPLEQPELVAGMVTRFLTMDLPPVTFDPIRRR